MSSSYEEAMERLVKVGSLVASAVFSGMSYKEISEHLQEEGYYLTADGVGHMARLMKVEPYFTGTETYEEWLKKIEPALRLGTESGMALRPLTVMLSKSGFKSRRGNPLNHVTVYRALQALNLTIQDEDRLDD